MSALTPHLDILPPPQRALWPELAIVPRAFVLYGGTGLALRLGHRASVDFDFFAHAPLDQRSLENALPFVRDGETVQEEPNARTVLVRRGNGSVKVSFFGGIVFGRVGEPEETADKAIRVASLLDLAGTKVKALLQRVEAKDYLDIAALLRHGVSLGEIFAAARALFGTSFNPLIAQKTLAYFEGGDLASLDASTRALLLTEATREWTVEPLPKSSSSLV